MSSFNEGRMDRDIHFNGKDYRVSRQRVDTGEEAYETISIFDDEGLVVGLEYSKSDFDEFDMLSERTDEEVEIYERGSNEEPDLNEFRDLYNNLNGGQLDVDVDRELSGSETAETYKQNK